MPRWEYLKKSSANDLTEIELSNLGNLGWELISVFSSAVRITYIFKRPLEN